MRICPSCGYNTPIDTVERCPLDGKPLTRKGPAGDPMLGRVLGERFLIEERIGKGGMGTVYKAKQLSIDRTVALKVVRNPGDEELVERFQREARYISRVTDPHVVTLYDFGQAEDGILFIAMEFLNGESLAQRINRVSRLTPLAACQLAQQVCQALSAAHAKGIVHRDLKPDNVFYALDDSGGEAREVVKVLDFGLAKAFRDEMIDQSLTNVGDVFGTPLYMSPEQVRGEAVDHRTDLYALGVLLYEALTGTPPFRGQSVHETLHMQVSATPEPLTKRRPGLVVPQRLEKLLFAMLSKERDARPANARVARRQFEDLARELAQRERRESRNVEVISPSGRVIGAEAASSGPTVIPADPTPEPRPLPPTVRYESAGVRPPTEATAPPSTDTQPIAAEVTPTPLQPRRARFSRAWYVGVGLGGVAIGTLLVILMPGDSGSSPGSGGRGPAGPAGLGQATIPTAAAQPVSPSPAGAGLGTAAGAAAGSAAPEGAAQAPTRVAAVAGTADGPGPAAGGVKAAGRGAVAPAAAGAARAPETSPSKAGRGARAGAAPRVAAPSTPRPRRNQVLLRFESVPPGAAVYEGGRRLGATPFELAVRRTRAAGHYVARLAGHRDDVRTVSLVTARPRQTVSFRLQRAVRRRRSIDTSHRARSTINRSKPKPKSKFGDHPVKFDD